MRPSRNHVALAVVAGGEHGSPAVRVEEDCGHLESVRSSLYGPGNTQEARGGNPCTEKGASVGTGGIEKTVRLVLDLPTGQDWAWLPDCNIIVLGSHLTPAGQENALSELQSTWRRQFIKAVPEPPACPDVA